MVLHIDVFSHHLGKSSLPDFSLPKVGCMFCAGCLDFPYRLQSTGHLWAAHHMCCTGIAALSKSVLSFSFDCVGNVDNLYSLGQGGLIAVKLILNWLCLHVGTGRYPTNRRGNCVCAAGKSRTETYIGSLRVLDHCLHVLKTSGWGMKA